MSFSAEDEGSGRPKLTLQPPGASPADSQSPTAAKSSRPNPFGAARPREQVIAEREGKRETEVLKEQAKKEWKPQVVLTEAQREEKKAIEAELTFARSELEKEEDSEKEKILREEVASKERKLEELLASFEKLAVQSVQTGSTRRSFDKRRDDNLSPSSPMSYGATAYGGREGAFREDGFGNFRSRGRDGGDRVASYGDTWGGTRGRSGGQSECYTCGEIGHFSRECPRGGSYGSNFGGARGSGGRACYTCGQEGHFSRECPQGGGYGPRGGAYSGAPSYGGAFGRGDEASPYATSPGGYGGNAYDASGYSGTNYGARKDYMGQGDLSYNRSR